MRKLSIICTAIAAAIILLTGCHTPKGADGSTVDGLVTAPFVVIGAIIVCPVYIADKTWELSSAGGKTHVYASPGTTAGDFENAINKAEGQQCYVDIVMQSDGVMALKYRGKKAVYYGKFREGHAIKY